MTILSDFRGQGSKRRSGPAECARALDDILKLFQSILDTPCSLLWQGAADSIAPRIPPGRIEGAVPGGCWGYPGGPWASLGGPWGSLGGSLGGPRGSSGRAREAPKTQKVFSGCLGGVLGLPWGDFGRRGWAWGPTWEVEMLIFHWI